jgi:transposase
LNNRRCLLDKRIDIDNQIRGTLKVFGMKVGTISASNFDARVRELLGKDTELEAYIAPLLKARKELQEQCLNLENILIKIAKDDDVCHRLMTIPGVGFLTALVFKTAIDNPIRFRSSKTVAASLGLTPRKYASGEIDYDGSITKCGDDMARSHLYEAARSLMCRTKKWNSIKAWGMRIARRSSVKNACVAVARKLATVMHRMWVDGTDFHWGKEQPEAI